MDPQCKASFLDSLEKRAAFKKQGLKDQANQVFDHFRDTGLEGKKPNLLMQINEFIINGMLSGLGTPVVNVIGNGIQAVLKPVLKAISSSLPRVVTGKTAQEAAIAKREARAMLSSLMDGWKHDLLFFNMGMKTGVPANFEVSPRMLGISRKEFNQMFEDFGLFPDPVTGEIDQELARRVLNESYDYMSQAIPGRAGKIIRWPTKLTVAIDEYFKARMRSQKMLGLLARKASMDEAAGKGDYEALYEQYKKQVFKGDTHKNLYANMDRFEEVIGDDIGTAIYDVKNYAVDGTFQAKLTGTMKKLQEAKGEGRTAGEMALTQILPFLRTPWNIFKESASYIPGVGAVIKPSHTVTVKHMRQNADGDVYESFETATKALNWKENKEELVARQLVGFGAVASMYALYADGRITGSEPTDPAERNTWRAEGIQPLSIKVGDVWVSYARIEPLATVMGLAADTFALQDRLNNGDVMPDKLGEEATKVAWSSIKANVMQKTFMQGFADMTDALFSDNPNKVGAYFDNLAKRTIPAISNTAARGIDPYEREAISTIDKLQQRIPYLRQLLPAQYGAFSENPDVIEPLRTNTAQAVTGIAAGWDQTEFSKAISDLGIRVAPTSKKMGGQALTTEQLGFYKREINRAATPLIARVLPSLQKMDRKTAQYVFEKRVMPAARKIAQAKLLKEYPDLRKRIINEKIFERTGQLPE